MKISVLCPDMSNNCLGRAHMLARILQRRYDVEISGPVLSGGGIWEPVAGDDSVPYVTDGKVSGDVIYASKPLLTSFGRGLIEKINDKKPLVLDIDDWELGGLRETWRGLSFKGRARYAAASICSVKAPSSYVNSWISDKLVPFAGDITVSNSFLKKRFGGRIVWHARDTEAFDPAKYDGVAARQKYGLPTDKKIIMFLGSPRPWKGLEDLISAVSLLGRKDVVLAIVGFREEDYCRGLKARAEEELGGMFVGLGMRPFGAIPEILSAADIVAIPQKMKGSPMGQMPAKVFDAMAMAKPVVATRVSDLGEVLSGCGWTVDPDDPEELASAVREALDYPGLARERGLKAREKCVKYYSWHAMEKVLVEIFDKYSKR